MRLRTTRMSARTGPLLKIGAALIGALRQCCQGSLCFSSFVIFPATIPTERIEDMARNLLDTELQHLSGMETTSQALTRHLAAPILSLLFLLLVAAWAGLSIGPTSVSLTVVLAAIVAGYMALNIGANDVANNVGPAVGANAITMLMALLMAALCEAAGALLAGGGVVTTVASGLLVEVDLDSSRIVLVMISALFASAIWVHVSTFVRAPVSTTHSIVGGVAGAGIAAAGLGAVSWPDIFAIAFGWVTSPVAGGGIAALLLFLTQVTITRRSDKLNAARRWVPAFVAAMTGTFAMYLASKSLHYIWP
ncbi:MAG: hypothetical protein EOP20_00395, partial [Hyphomicrobiales bacterium]